MLAGALALPVLLVLQSTSVPAGETGTATAAARREVRFGEDLKVGDIELAEPRGFAHVDFFMEPGTRPGPGSSLRLVFEFSPDLDGRSFLSVSLNQGLLRSVRLDPGRGTGGELEIPIPEAMLQPSNHLVISVEQAASRNARAWTRILARSSLSLASERVPVPWSLADLPAPLLHRRTYGERRLAVVLPSDPSAATVESMALAIADLSRRVAPQTISLTFVARIAEATAPVLMVGTPREQPDLRDLGFPRPLRLPPATSAPALTFDGNRITDSTGVLALVKEAPG